MAPSPPTAAPTCPSCCCCCRHSRAVHRPEAHRRRSAPPGGSGSVKPGGAVSPCPSSKPAAAAWPTPECIIPCHQIGQYTSLRPHTPPVHPFCISFYTHGACTDAPFAACPCPLFRLSSPFERGRASWRPVKPACHNAPTSASCADLKCLYLGSRVVSVLLVHCGGCHCHRCRPLHLAPLEARSGAEWKAAAGGARERAWGRYAGKRTGMQRRSTGEDSRGGEHSGKEHRRLCR